MQLNKENGSLYVMLIILYKANKIIETTISQKNKINKVIKLKANNRINVTTEAIL